MKRREFLQATAASLLFPTQGGCAQTVGSTLGDAALRLNPAIFPEERVEKREYDNSGQDGVKWEMSTCKSRVPPKEQLFTQHQAFLEGLSTQESMPCVSSPLIRQDVQSTPRNGFYFYFKTTVACLKLPNMRPPEFVSTNGKYFCCWGQPEFVQDFIFPKGWISIDYREMKLIEGSKIYRPEQEVYRPVKDGVLLKVAPSLTSIAGPAVYPGREWKGSSLWIEKYLFFDIPYRPLRFKVELPPLIVGGLEVPFPVSYFEPYDAMNRKWID